MPLIPTLLETQILFALQKQAAAAKSPGASLEQTQIEFARDLAIAIDSYIRSATIIVQPGQVVTGVAGPAPVAAATVSPSLPALIT